MKRKIIIQIAAVALAFSLIGCGNTNVDESTTEVVAEESTEEETTDAEVAEEATEEVVEEETTENDVAAGLDLDDGAYMVNFDTDNSMFHVNETMDGKALLTVEGGMGNLHLVMPSKNVLNLYLGMADDAKDNESDWINPSTETVTYDDGLSEEVYAFDVPVSVMDDEFDLALIGKKEVWYDHKVSISNPEPVDASESDAGKESTEETATTESVNKTIEVSLEGGTGKAKLTSPTVIQETSDGYLVTIEWSSKYYDYMIVDDIKYEPVETGEHSLFEIPVSDINVPLNVIADTVAMSTPHEIEYTITFNADSMK